MNRLLTITSILGVISLLIKLFFDDKLSPEITTVLLIVCVIFASVDNLIWVFIKAGATIFGFGYLLIGFAYDINGFISLLQPILTMLIALLGVFIVIRVFFGKSIINNEEHFIYNRKTRQLRKKNTWW